jgi:septal ring factor EnvC (AmiA/AmiB activator)
MTGPQVKQRVEELERELAAAKEQEAKAAREKAAADELANAKALLTKIATTYNGTDAGAKAQQTLDLMLLSSKSGSGGLVPLPPVLGKADSPR